MYGMESYVKISILVAIVIVVIIAVLKNDINAKSENISTKQQPNKVKHKDLEVKTTSIFPTSEEGVQYLKQIREDARNFLIEEQAKTFLKEYIDEVGGVREAQKKIKEYIEAYSKEQQGTNKIERQATTTNYRIIHDEDRIYLIIKRAEEILDSIQSGISISLEVDNSIEYEVRKFRYQLYDMGILPWSIITQCGGSVEDVIKNMYTMLEGDYYDTILLQEWLHTALKGLYREECEVMLMWSQLISGDLVKSVNKADRAVDFYRRITEELTHGDSEKIEEPIDFAVDIIICFVYNQMIGELYGVRTPR